jgi:hypothetical protein
MGQFTSKILAEFQPPKKWKLGRDLVYTTSDLYANEVKALKDVGVEIVRDTNKTETITVPTGFITDLASTPRLLWNVIAPFDVARAAIVHDLLYKAIRTYRWNVSKTMPGEDKELIKNAKKASDKVFLLAMKDAEPKVSGWKIYSAWKAVDLFGRWSIIPNEKNI